MHSNKDTLLKGIKRLGYTTLLMFSAPFALYQAFKNENHPLFIPVLILGIVLAIAAIVMAFYAIKTIMDGLFDTK
ncbi:hypothetical protein H0I23_08845 [Cellulophaga sp. HaHaR_3_176]|uniref:DUF6095 family protein n=1 Tax=Cellulophaga sp. HaHaR_3_176 TaxID=1942464 RepID=UPI001C1F4774|nr:DUF6095 family protein [Cellulophaga sp. HaHaR_3_176]QWX82584.1 hypothetical protein H0I23_08845 [Cellulophaga sp. HaHaR_3_176]